MVTRQYGEPVDRSKRAPTGNHRESSVYGRRTADSIEPKPRKEDPSPSANVVAAFHRRADTDSRVEAIHHTLGPVGSQASPGDHNHDGGSSRLLLEGMLLTGSKSNPTTMWPSIIACLVRLGAKDNTTA